MLVRHKIAGASTALFFLFLACSSSGDKAPNLAAANAVQQAAPDGMAIFRKYCVACHGSDGKLGLNGAKDLTKSALAKAERMSLVRLGKGMMTPFEELLSPEEIEAVVDYTLTLKSN